MRSTDIIEKLVELKFPVLRSVDAASFSGKITAEYRDVMKAEAAEYRAKLVAMPQHERIAFYQRMVEDREERAEIAAQQEDEGRFFQQRNAVADYEYWTKAEYWTLDEAVILALGKDPNVVNSANLAPYRLISPFVKRFLQLRNLAIRAKATGKLFDHVLPIVFLQWTIDSGIEVPAEMRDLITEKARRIDWASLCARQSEAIEVFKDQIAAKDGVIEELQALLAELREQAATLPEQIEIAEKKQSPIERDNMLKVILAMATQKYRYDPAKSRTDTAPNIRTALNQIGLDVSDDTIRRYLSMAEDRRAEWKEQDR